MQVWRERDTRRLVQIACCGACESVGLIFLEKESKKKKKKKKKNLLVLHRKLFHLKEQNEGENKTKTKM